MTEKTPDEMTESELADYYYQHRDELAGEVVSSTTAVPLTIDRRRRCPWAIRLVLLNTRCQEQAGHGRLHRAWGLESFYREHHKPQILQWYAGARSEYETDREDQFAWEEVPSGDTHTV